MSISTEIARIEAKKSIIRSKFVELGIAQSTDNIDKLAAAAGNIVNQGAVSVEISKTEPYTIPAGYHNGGGTVSVKDDSGDYTTQEKTVTPTPLGFTVTPDAGYFALKKVTVNGIPENYKDATVVTASAADVLSNKTIVTLAGAVAGTMPNNGAISKTIDGLNAMSVAISAGYHNGSGTVSLTGDIESELAKI